MTFSKHFGMLQTMAPKRVTLSAKVRQAVNASGMSRYAISKAAGKVRAQAEKGEAMTTEEPLENPGGEFIRAKRRTGTIQYKCPCCKTYLETDEALSGKQDTCPECGRVHPVPLSKQNSAKRKAAQKEAERALEEAERIRVQAQQRTREESQQRAREEQEKKYQGAAEEEARRWIRAHADCPVAGQICGVLLIMLGAIVTVGCLFVMDISVVDRIANLDKMNQRLCGTVVGMGLLIAGIIQGSLHAIHVRLWAVSVEGLGRRASATIPKHAERVVL